MNSWFPQSRPRTVEGGLRARSARGAIGQTWWSERFVSALEHLGLGNRLQRGRNYARRGQVLNLDVDAGAVTADVQGSRPRPYRVRIGLAAYGKAKWVELEEALAGEAWYAAQLLAGEMPEEIEDLFAAHGARLFPADVDELSLDCTCPDRAVPCKHIAAAFYLLAEAFDDDPFAILAWRGRDRETLLAALRSLRSSAASAQASVASRPLEECMDSYFDTAAPIPPLTRPAATGSALDALPDPGLSLRDRPLLDLLRPAYLAFADE
ncbi:MAG: SWIM zinc finger family protein [Nocardioides sp.]|uniref:SWIM zinc finger family protein n=1 Tax=Nocardioides sp. TaxID=35761 RepID=UPI0039E57E76